jgi:phosphate/sulfate permease
MTTIYTYLGIPLSLAPILFSAVAGAIPLEPAVLLPGDKINNKWA